MQPLGGVGGGVEATSTIGGVELPPPQEARNSAVSSKVQALVGFLFIVLYNQISCLCESLEYMMA